MIEQDLTRLLEEAHAYLSDDRLKRAVIRHCQGLPDDSAAGDLSTHIHPDCQMLAHSLQHHQDASLAVSQYFNVALQQYHTMRQITSALYPQGLGGLRFLDFACGYGRLLRFLVHAMPPEQIWGAEIQPDAVAYVSERFGVHPLHSPAEPEAFEPQQTFDVIWVASLFSHLPEPLFSRWLQRLTDLLTPDGILCFSTHDAVLLPPDIPMPQKGILYGQGSENAELDPAIYGTTYVTEEYVASCIHSLLGEQHPYYRLPRTLAHEQDIYVVSRSADRDLTVLGQFRRGPWGWMDHHSFDDAGNLHLSGWAASLDDGALESIEIRLDGELHHCPTGDPRQDVADAFNDSRLLPSGWHFNSPLPANRNDVYVEITARSTRGETALVYAGVMHNPNHGGAVSRLLRRMKSTAYRLKAGAASDR